MKKIVLLSVFAMFSFYAKSQDIVQWDFSSKKISDKMFELHMTPTIKNPWHIYSQLSPKGGALPTSIDFSANPLLIIDGKIKEVGKVITKYEDVFGVDVKYFDGKADFVQVVKLKANVKTNINGSITYMACKDGECLPPKTVEFSIRLQ